MHAGQRYDSINNPANALVDLKQPPKFWQSPTQALLELSLLLVTGELVEPALPVVNGQILDQKMYRYVEIALRSKGHLLIYPSVVMSNAVVGLYFVIFAFFRGWICGRRILP